ncbi:MotA/TolQ/ExbB proton channel family protein [Acidobacteria bacterium AH-259-G07]|nr:MotA/TolQ/ExbB proton channel family protein [Acidobacteria bacterium AH-259-L09]MDA2927646.1 MotA/TolQ/ExbB proton channel family protein [Acidobacteria bacterium AH-259-G07]
MTGFIEMWGQMGVLAQAVVVVLGFMSIWSISVMIERYITFRAARKQSRDFAPVVAEALKNGNIREAIELAEAKEHRKSHLAKVLVAGLQEFNAHEGSSAIPGETIEASKRALQRATAIGVEEFKRGLGGLATIGATAPFVGLFGTTIGIINAFTGMAAGEDTGLAAVAGGIAEALIATAFGLFVAIPAVWMYNYFSTKIESFVVEMDNSSSELVDYFLKRRAEKHGSES